MLARCWHSLGFLTAYAIMTLAAVPARSADLHEQSSDWHYGTYLDLSYAVDFNFPQNHRWRSKVPLPRVNELTPNIALTYVQKDASAQSQVGLELGGQGGYDTDALVPAPLPGREKPMPGADTLRHLSRANLSYVAPVGNGLTLTAGMFNSYTVTSLSLLGTISTTLEHKWPTTPPTT